MLDIYTDEELDIQSAYDLAMDKFILDKWVDELNQSDIDNDVHPLIILNWDISIIQKRED